MRKNLRRKALAVGGIIFAVFLALQGPTQIITAVTPHHDGPGLEQTLAARSKPKPRQDNSTPPPASTPATPAPAASGTETRQPSPPPSSPPAATGQRSGAATNSGTATPPVVQTGSNAPAPTGATTVHPNQARRALDEKSAPATTNVATPTTISGTRVQQSRTVVEPLVYGTGVNRVVVPVGTTIHVGSYPVYNPWFWGRPAPVYIPVDGTYARVPAPPVAWYVWLLRLLVLALIVWVIIAIVRALISSNSSSPE